MRPVLLATVVILSAVPALHAQDDLAGKISCHRAGFPETQNRPYTQRLWDGYEISLGPARNGGVGGNVCPPAIFDSCRYTVRHTHPRIAIPEPRRTRQAMSRTATKHVHLDSAIGSAAKSF